MSSTPPPPPPFGTPPPPSYGGPGDGAPGYGPPPGYGPQPGYGPPPGGGSNGMAVAALIVGITALVTVCLSPAGIIAVGLGIAGLSRAKRMGGTGKGMAIGGIVTGALALLVAIGLFVSFVLLADEVDSDPRDGVCNEDRYLQDPDC